MLYRWIKAKIGRQEGRLEELEPGAIATQKWLASGWIESAEEADVIAARSIEDPPADRAVRRKRASKVTVGTK